MVGDLVLGHHPVYSPKPVDNEVVGLPPAHEFQKRFADELEHPVFPGFKGSLLALGGVEHQAHGFGPPHGLGPISGECQIGTRARGNQETVIDPQAVAIGLRLAGLFHQPHIRGVGHVGDANRHGRTRHRFLGRDRGKQSRE